MRKLKIILTCLLCFSLLCFGQTSNYTINAAENELIVSDNYPDFEGWLDNLGLSDTVKITASSIGTDKTILPKQVTLLTGWDGGFFGTDQPKVRQFGYNEGSFTFESGSQTIVQYLNFNMPDKAIIIPEKTNITFKNCIFVNTVVNNGIATFEDCVFTNGKIENNGTAKYTGSSQEPENIGSSKLSHIALDINLQEETLNNAIINQEYLHRISYELIGTNKDNAIVETSVSDESGLIAKIENNTIQLSGVPKTMEPIIVYVTASAKGDKTVTKQITIYVNEEISIRIDGQLPCITKGQNGYQAYLDVFVKTGNNEEINYYDYIQTNSLAKLTTNITPNDSGMNVSYLFDQLVVSGKPVKSGTYQISVTLEDKGQIVSSNAIELRIYEGNETLKQQFALIDHQQTTWDMEPYEIWQSDHAIVPTWLTHIYGSHESGLYGQIGNNQSLATDTLIIPKDSHVTLENIKINNSVKVIVESGGSLTLKDSVIFGPIEINGGIFSMDSSSALTDTLTLNDGSVLKDANIESNARFLTDGAIKPDIENVVIVNGKITVEGTNVIQGDSGSGSLAGQTALIVNGEVVINKDSTLTVNGGGDENYAPGHIGGIGIQLNSGVISGAGTLIVNGGVGNDGPGGDAITGQGKISVNELISNGGDSHKIIDKLYAGGNALGKEVIVTSKNVTLKGGDGNPKGSAVIYKTEEITDSKNSAVPEISISNNLLSNNINNDTTSNIKTGDKSTADNLLGLICISGIFISMLMKKEN